MSRDVVAAQRVLAQLLADVQSRRIWERDPRGFAKTYLSGSDEIKMISNLSRVGIAAAAIHLDLKRVMSRRRATPAHAPLHTKPQTAKLRPTQAAPSMVNPLNVAKKPPLVGLGYWPGLVRTLSNESVLVDVWEHRIDDCIKHNSLENLYSRFGGAAIVLHSVDLSLGSPEATADENVLSQMRAVLQVTKASELSDHLGFTRVAGRSLGHFEPIWRVEESVHLVAGNIERLQEALRTRIAVENIAPTFDPGGEMTTSEFLNEIVKRTGCGILLDISNYMLSDHNGFCDASKELKALNLNAVVGVHLAGGAEEDGLFYDAHAFPVANEDITWLEKLLPRMSNCRSIVIERDSRHDEIKEIVSDLRRVRTAIQAASTSTSLGNAHGRTA